MLGQPRSDAKKGDEPGAVESTILRLAQQAMEYMSHLVEESNNVVMSHQCRLVRCGLSQVGNHSCNRIDSLSVRTLVPR